MKASDSKRPLILVATTVFGLFLVSATALYFLVQNKKSLPPVAQALLGGRVVHITSDGMAPTLNSGDIVTFDTRAYLDHEPQRGDIVLFVAPGDPSRVFVKRIIATPNHRLRIADGVVLIDGEAFSEPYVVKAWTVDTSWPTSGTDQLVPRGQYFVMGDNRDHSSDSRQFGFIARDMILGKLIR